MYIQPISNKQMKKKMKGKEKGSGQQYGKITETGTLRQRDVPRYRIINALKLDNTNTGIYSSLMLLNKAV